MHLASPDPDYLEQPLRTRGKLTREESSQVICSGQDRRPWQLTGANSSALRQAGSTEAHPGTSPRTFQVEVTSYPERTEPRARVRLGASLTRPPGKCPRGLTRETCRAAHVVNRQERPSGQVPQCGGAVTGGVVTGGVVTGGAVTGGAVTGGAVTGGAVTGGVVTGGVVTGGVVTGGAVTGGVVTGGAVTGGAVTGGAVTGGAVTGGAVGNGVGWGVSAGAPGVTGPGSAGVLPAGAGGPPASSPVPAAWDWLAVACTGVVPGGSGGMTRSGRPGRRAARQWPQAR